MRDFKKQQVEEVRAFLERNDLEIGSVDAKTVVMRKFGMNQRRFYYVKSLL